MATKTACIKKISVNLTYELSIIYGLIYGTMVYDSKFIMNLKSRENIFYHLLFGDWHLNNVLWGVEGWEKDFPR